MEIKINISGSTIQDSEIMNGMNIGRNGNIDVKVSDSSITGKSQVINNISGDGSLTYRANNVKISENATVMNGRKLKNGETVVVNHNGTNYSENSIKGTQTTQTRPSITKISKKESLLKKLARIFSRKNVSQDIDRVEDRVKTIRDDEHEEFLNMISGYGEYRKPEYSQINTVPKIGTDEKLAMRTKNSEGR